MLKINHLYNSIPLNKVPLPRQNINTDYQILLPGQFTKVRLLLDVREAAVVVPNKAIAIEKGGAYIFVVRADSIAERRMVELGPEVGNNVIIERGLVPHENIVVEGFHKLTHGDKVIPSTYRAEQEDHSKN